MDWRKAELGVQAFAAQNSSFRRLWTDGYNAAAAGSGEQQNSASTDGQSVSSKKTKRVSFDDRTTATDSSSSLNTPHSKRVRAPSSVPRGAGAASGAGAVAVVTPSAPSPTPSGPSSDPRPGSGSGPLYSPAMAGGGCESGGQWQWWELWSERDCERIVEAVLSVGPCDPGALRRLQELLLCGALSPIRVLQEASKRSSQSAVCLMRLLCQVETCRQLVQRWAARQKPAAGPYVPWLSFLREDCLVAMTHFVPSVPTSRARLNPMDLRTARSGDARFDRIQMEVMRTGLLPLAVAVDGEQEADLTYWLRGFLSWFPNAELALKTCFLEAARWLSPF